MGINKYSWFLQNNLTRHSRDFRIIKRVDLKMNIFAINLDVVSSSKVFNTFDCIKIRIINLFEVFFCQTIKCYERALHIRKTIFKLYVYITYRVIPIRIKKDHNNDKILYTQI